MSRARDTTEDPRDTRLSASKSMMFTRVARRKG